MLFEQTVPEILHGKQQTWKEQFGKDAEEAFMCYSYADYMGKLAESGKKIYPLPMFTNVWLKNGNDEKPGEFPCGGPQPDMLDIWKKAAQGIDFIAPDIYSFQFEEIAGRYTREDNPLFVPETRRDKWHLPIYTMQSGNIAICYSPFGAESIGENKSFYYTDRPYGYER